MKVRYQFLDALRGYAAIGVVLFHIGTRFGGLHTAVNGYIAVDFFFILSGVVLASAYEDRLVAKLTFAQFFVLRLIRLMPMAILGVLLGTGYLLMRYRLAPAFSDPLPDIVRASTLNVFLLPKLWITAATGDETFPANGPLWSLSVEVIANLVWARFLIGARLRTLTVVCGAGALMIAIMALWNGTGDVGWNASTYLGGIGRITFGFTLGIILYRVRTQMRFSASTWHWLALALLSVSIFLPLKPVAWILVCTFFLLPFAVAFGMGREDCRFSPIDDLLGRISYPLYAIHYPILMVASGLQKRFLKGANMPVLAFALLIAILLASYLAMRCYDEPVRAYFGRLRARSRPNLAGLDTGGLA